MERLKVHLPPIFRQYGVAVAYLFGSQALGLDDPFSDVDIAVLFFEPPNDADFWQRWHQLAARIEPVVGTRELDLVFLQRAPLLLQWQVISEGKLLYCADEELRLDFEERIIGEWLDFSEWLRRFHDDMVRGILERRNHA